LFEIFLTDEAKNQLERLKKDKGLEKRYNAVKKAIRFLSENPRHKSLKTHEFTSLHGPRGEKIFEAYAEQSTPAAYRIFWYYGPDKNQITIVAITPHP
jgi:mRNA-degrading endonuclease RelE of RelBE toxin-antitoxin system